MRFDGHISKLFHVINNSTGTELNSPRFKTIEVVRIPFANITEQYHHEPQEVNKKCLRLIQSLKDKEFYLVNGQLIVARANSSEALPLHEYLKVSYLKKPNQPQSQNQDPQVSQTRKRKVMDQTSRSDTVDTDNPFQVNYAYDNDGLTFKVLKNLKYSINLNLRQAIDLDLFGLKTKSVEVNIKDVKTLVPNLQVLGEILEAVDQLLYRQSSNNLTYRRTLFEKYDMDQIANLQICYPQTKHLDFSWCPDEDEFEKYKKFTDFLKNQTSIESIRVNCDNFVIPHLVDAIKDNTSIKKLNIVGDVNGEDSISGLTTALLGNRSITEFSLGEEQPFGWLFEEWATSLESSLIDRLDQMKRIYIRNALPSGCWIELLTALETNTSLVDLSLEINLRDYSGDADEDNALLAACQMLKNNKTLKHLNLLQMPNDRPRPQRKHYLPLIKAMFAHNSLVELRFPVDYEDCMNSDGYPIPAPENGKPHVEYFTDYIDSLSKPMLNMFSERNILHRNWQSFMPKQITDMVLSTLETHYPGISKTTPPEYKSEQINLEGDTENPQIRITKQY